eukprot:TRINITY_DN6864_c0_g1_i1.p1 TRINITY_DN6864_c0_g1~~TRINITY_DN6864_c0_g1_i1.p1  ORF type:complete len:264 (-),score=48.87 TRINITY_DN6864_c0_g1_i1:24-815(-)
MMEQVYISSNEPTCVKCEFEGKLINVRGLSTYYHWLPLSKEGGHWSIEIVLREAGIYIFQFIVDDVYKANHNLKTIHYANQQWNFLIVDYVYSLELVQDLYNVMDTLINENKNYTIFFSFIKKYKEFNIDTRIVFGGDGDCGTLLHLASLNHLENIVKVLLEKGSNMNKRIEGVKSVNGQTALSLALKRRKFHVLLEYQLHVSFYWYKIEHFPLLSHDIQTIIYTVYIIKLKDTSLTILPNELLQRTLSFYLQHYHPTNFFLR